jgi:hypothetical protein
MIRVMGWRFPHAYGIAVQLVIRHIREQTGIELVVAYAGIQAYQATFELKPSLGPIIKDPRFLRSINACVSPLITFVSVPVIDPSGRLIARTTLCTGPYATGCRVVVVGATTPSDIYTAIELRVHQAVYFPGSAR